MWSDRVRVSKSPRSGCFSLCAPELRRIPMVAYVLMETQAPADQGRTARECWPRPSAIHSRTMRSSRLRRCCPRSRRSATNAAFTGLCVVTRSVVCHCGDRAIAAPLGPLRGPALSPSPPLLYEAGPRFRLQHPVEMTQPRNQVRLSGACRGSRPGGGWQSFSLIGRLSRKLCAAASCSPGHR